MEQALVAEAKEAPRAADLAFDRLYRSSRDDVYAYVASLLRDAPAADLDSVGAEEGAERSERRLAVSAALERLAPGERELIALKFFAGLENREIARVLAISESNAGTKLHRAMTKLREACDGHA
jgi:DNA-directed RNA polymerase specialized sigma24 family protein